MKPIGKNQKRFLELIAKYPDGLTYKELAIRVFGKINYDTLNSCRSIAVKLRKKGIPIYNQGLNGIVKIIDKKSEWSNTANNWRSRLESNANGFGRLLGQIYEAEPDLIPEAKLHLNELQRLLMDFEEGHYRRKLLAETNGTQNN